MKSLRLAFVATIIVATTSFSQGIYLNKGESGVGLEVGFQSDNNGKGFSITPAYSFQGYVDISAGYEKAFLDDKLSDINGDDQSVIGEGYRGDFSVHALKEDANIPVTLSVDVNYEHITLTSKALDSYKAEATGNSMGFGISASKHLAVAEGFYLTPIIGYDFMNVKSKINFTDPSLGLGPDQNESNNNWNVSLILGFQKEINNRFSIILSGGDAIDDQGNNAQGVALAFILKM